MAKHLPECASLDELYKWAQKKYGLRRTTVRKLFERRDEWKAYTQANKLGKGSRGSWRGKGIRTARSLMKDQSFGVRAKGAGTKAHFPWAIPALKLWLEVERSYGHSLGKKDLLHQFTELLSERAGRSEHEAEKKLCLDRIDKLAKSIKYRESQTNYLMAKTGARFLRPHQVCMLST